MHPLCASRARSHFLGRKQAPEPRQKRLELVDRFLELRFVRGRQLVEAKPASRRVALVVLVVLELAADEELRVGLQVGLLPLVPLLVVANPSGIAKPAEGRGLGCEYGGVRWQRVGGVRPGQHLPEPEKVLELRDLESRRRHRVLGVVTPVAPVTWPYLRRCRRAGRLDVARRPAGVDAGLPVAVLVRRRAQPPPVLLARDAHGRGGHRSDDQDEGTGAQVWRE